MTADLDSTADIVRFVLEYKSSVTIVFFYDSSSTWAGGVVAALMSPSYRRVQAAFQREIADQQVFFYRADVAKDPQMKSWFRIRLDLSFHVFWGGHQLISLNGFNSEIEYELLFWIKTPLCWTGSGRTEVSRTIDREAFPIQPYQTSTTATPTTSIDEPTSTEYDTPIETGTENQAERTRFLKVRRLRNREDANDLLRHCNYQPPAGKSIVRGGRHRRF
ncbi:hypothetical protein TWF694_008991 [Orbilia ellipsospora]|uniref:Uncharacterized protein n=1 Tax=Orbilia ellipsospora TaxID=2528407 RepID=A0AAV9XGV2_9PEZI